MKYGLNYSGTVEGRRCSYCLPSHIHLHLPSLLPSLPAPSIRTPGRQETWMYSQLIIQTPINHPPSNYTPSASARSSRWFQADASAVRFVQEKLCSEQQAMQSNLLCSIYALDWNCVLIREMMGQVFWVQLHVSEEPRSAASQSPGVAAGCGVRQPLLFDS